MELRCSWTLRQFDRGLSFLFTTERKGPREERSFSEPPLPADVVEDDAVLFCEENET